MRVLLFSFFLLSALSAKAYYPFLCVHVAKDVSCSDSSKRYSGVISAFNEKYARSQCLKIATRNNEKYCFHLDYSDTSVKKCVNSNQRLFFECLLYRVEARSSVKIYQPVKASSESEAKVLCKSFESNSPRVRFFGDVLADCK